MTLKAPLAALAFAALSVAACDMPYDQAIETPVTRTFRWFGYVGGDDIRANCAQGRNHIRAVYNGLWEEQVRAYDLVLQPDGTAHFTSRVIAGGPANVSSIEMYDLGDITSPWNAKRGKRVLSREETRELLGLLQQSAAFGPPRGGMRLPDNDFWWTVASCRNGAWGYQAWHHPTDGFVNVRFAEKLFALDPVTVPVNRPRKLEPAEMRYDAIKGPQRGRADRWMLVVGRDGLAQR